MQHEVIIKRKNGDTVKIEVSLRMFDNYQLDANGNWFRYDTIERIKAKGKHTFVYLSDITTPDEIKAAKLELWNRIKP